MIDFTALADLCNSDSRFQEARLQESAVSLESLMATKDFQTALLHLATHNKRPTLEAHIAALYACRMAERKSQLKSLRVTEAAT